MVRMTLHPSDNVVFRGKVGEVVQEHQPSGRIFERYRRPPGTRLIIISSDHKILITKEHRAEAAGLDLRLPGGKVRDNVEDYHELLASGQDMVEAAAEAAKKEAAEETGLVVKDLRFLTKANAGATVEWDLYYFLINQYQVSPHGQQLEHGEDIEVAWMTGPEILAAVAKGQMQEWRSVGVLLGLVLPELPTS
jgi:ADP-ribose pyrophosphatase